MIDASLRATVLANLQKLHRDFGISVIYITHDLATAYQISKNIVVMYSGSVAEVGDVELVVQDPQHPYTRLLIGSVPHPNPEKPWSAEGLEASPEVGERGETYCKCVDRCPHAMPKCAERAPALYQIDPHRLAACYLYESAPAVRLDEMSTVFDTSAAIAS
jgi:peptide/nickel transport system ATP-binding protein